MATFKTLDAAARAHGHANGVEGRAGGWLYRNGVRLCQGWHTYGINLVSADVIHVLDVHGRRVDREKTNHGFKTYPWSHWRRFARSFEVPSLDPEPEPMALQAVAVDTHFPQQPYVFWSAEDGVPFNAKTAQTFADRRNECLKVPTYKVFRLVPVAD